MLGDSHDLDDAIVSGSAKADDRDASAVVVWRCQDLAFRTAPVFLRGASDAEGTA